jgi:hypothetical protein
MSARWMLLVAAIVIAVVAVASTRTATPAPRAAGNGVAVVELFTSQGCSSCPPADRVLSALGEEQFDGTVIPLAFHVDYWNSIGWNDPFSSPAWSQRQRAYAAAMKSTQVYTPQVVLNGRSQAVGNDGAAVRREIARQLAAAPAGSVAIRNVRRERGAVTVELDAALAAGARGATLQIVVFENGVTTAVTRGENSGRKLTNDFIVRAMESAATVAPGQTVRARTVTLKLDPHWNSGKLGVAAFLQDPQTLTIYGAAVNR